MRVRSRSRSRSRRPSGILKRLRELREHGDDAIEELLALPMSLVGDELASHADVEHRRRLRRRTHGRQVIPSLVTLGELPGALCYVVDDRRGSPRQLIGQVPAATGELLDYLVGEIEEVERDLVDLEALMIEWHCAVPLGSGSGSGSGQQRL